MGERQEASPQNPLSSPKILLVILSITILPSLHTPGFAFGHFRDWEERLLGNPGKGPLFLLKKVEVKGECPPSKINPQTTQAADCRVRAFSVLNSESTLKLFSFWVDRKKNVGPAQKGDTESLALDLWLEKGATVTISTLNPRSLLSKRKQIYPGCLPAILSQQVWKARSSGMLTEAHIYFLTAWN